MPKIKPSFLKMPSQRLTEMAGNASVAIERPKGNAQRSECRQTPIQPKAPLDLFGNANGGTDRRTKPALLSRCRKTVILPPTGINGNAIAAMYDLTMSASSCVCQRTPILRTTAMDEGGNVIVDLMRQRRHVLLSPSRRMPISISQVHVGNVIDRTRRGREGALSSSRHAAQDCGAEIGLSLTSNQRNDIIHGL